MDQFIKEWNIREKSGGKWVCHICGRPAYKTDDKNLLWCDGCIAESIKKQRKQMQVKYSVKRIGRNELCPCGSGKKIKHCCIDKTV